MITNNIDVNKIILLVIIAFSVMFSFAQSEELKNDNKAKNRYVIWMVPSAASNVYGIAIGPIGSESVCNRPYTKFSHGLNIQLIGKGIFQPFYIKHANFEGFNSSDGNESRSFSDTLDKRAIHNGILLSSFGIYTDQVNGISLSPWMSMGKKINGIHVICSGIGMKESMVFQSGLSTMQL
jgi:hypothetical protein